MKRSNLSKVFGSALLTASLAVVPFAVPAIAQTDTAPRSDSNTNTAPRGDVRNADSDNNDVDWGWLGLLGLLGLAGLVRGRDRAPDTVAGSTYPR